MPTEPDAEYEVIDSAGDDCDSKQIQLRRWAVPGGWVYATIVVQWRNCDQHGGGCMDELSSSICFVPEPRHAS